jgi:hypothetical protein
MTSEGNESSSTENGAEDPPKDTRGTPPRGNPDRDHESVQKGEEQLDKISGN